MTDHRIIITREPGQGLFVVDIDPPLGESWRRSYADHASARGFAGGIKMSRGFPIDDRSGGANG